VTAPSPVTLATSIVNILVTANGTALDPSVQIASIEVWNAVNKLPKARLVISDGGPAAQNFPLSASATFVPGNTLAIALGYGSSQTTVFSGVIYRHGIEFARNTPSRLVVEATDKAMVMTLARQNAIFQNVTDSALCQKLIENAGLSAAVTSTSVTHDAIVQYYSSAWDLLVMRAQASGMVVSVADGKVTVAPPDTSGEPVLTLAYGDGLLDFRADMDASTQYAASAIQSFAWDPSTQALATSSTASASVTTPGNISSSTLASVFNVSQYLQQSAGALQTGELTQWSSAELLLRELAKIRGEARFTGSALAVPGSMVALSGLGDRFNGNAYVSGVYHSVHDGFWRTTAELGLSPDWFADKARAITAPGASGQLPPIDNLQIGTVKQIDSDPQNEFRVLVTLPLLQASDGAGVWARFGSYYASNGVGSFFYPEIGDEVVVAFLSGDPRYAVILGSLYSAKNPAPLTPAAGNNTKSLVSRSKLHIDFVDDNKQILVATPANQQMLLDDQNGAVTIADKNGNSIKLDSSGITLTSASAVAIKANSSVSVTAQAEFTMSAQASASLSADGMMTVKGATVALNP